MQVLIAEREAGGTWSEPIDFVAPLDSDVFDPVVAVHSDGTAVVAWTRNTTSIPSRTIVEARYRQAGGSFGDPVTLSDPSVNAETPGIAFAPDGTAYVAYGHGLSSSSTRAALHPGAGRRTRGRPRQSAAARPRRPVYDARVGVGSDGRVVVVVGNGLPELRRRRGRGRDRREGEPAHGRAGTGRTDAVTLDSQLRCSPDARLAYRGTAGRRSSGATRTATPRASCEWPPSAPSATPPLTSSRARRRTPARASACLGSSRSPLTLTGDATLAWIADGDVKVARNPGGDGSANFLAPDVVDDEEGPVYGGNGLDPAFDLAVGTNGRAAVSFIRDFGTVRVGRSVEVGGWDVATVVPAVESKNRQDTDVAFDDNDSIVLASVGQGETEQYVPRLDVFDMTPPVVDTASMPTTGTAGHALTFEGTASDDWTTPVLRWFDGPSLFGTGSPLEHAFTTGGVKSISVVARSAGGDSAPITGSVTITVPPPTTTPGTDTQQPVVEGPPPADQPPNSPPQPQPLQPQPPAPPTARELAGELTSSVVEELGGSLKTVTSGFVVEGQAPGAGQLASCVFLGKGTTAQCLTGTATRRAAVASAAAKKKKRKKAAPKNLLARGTKTFAAAGKASIRVKPTKVAKARLKGRKRASLTVMTVFRPAGGGAPVVTKTTVTLKR